MSCTTRSDGATVHRTRFLHDDNGQVLGRACVCRRYMVTPAGHVSDPRPHPMDGTPTNEAHLRRMIAAARLFDPGLINRVRAFIKERMPR